MKTTLNNILAITIPEKKLRFLLLLIVILIDGILEITGIASIMPFLAVLANQNIIQTNSILSFVYNYFGFSSNSQFLIFLALSVLTVLVISNCFSAITKWYSLHFVYSRGNYLACRLFQNYLSKPYSFFLDNNSSTLIKNITIETHRITFGVISPIILIFNKIIIIFFILGLLVYVDPLLSLLVLLIAGGSFLVIFNVTKKLLGKTGKYATENQAARHKVSSESLSGIKFLKLLNKERYYTGIFKKYSSQFSTSEASAQGIANFPKFVLETIIFGGVVLITLYFIIYRNDTNNILPALGIYALAGYRILPGLNLIIHGTSLIKFHYNSLENISQDLFCKVNQSATNNLPLRSIQFSEQISLQKITYSYPFSDHTLFSKLDLTISKNDIIALVGKTGSGKSTLIDLILGLLKPQNGSILIDNNILDDQTIVSWQKIIGYVPQHIYLLDNTVSKNIAFGLPDKDIDFSRVRQAARTAEIDDFISAELANGYDTIIGENGIRLSGGQRQRIGIARAFYLEPQVLVLDEATSSLDTATENDIMNSIYKLSDKITIILVTHRLSSIINCDKIFFLENGAIAASGTYKELLKTCPSFSKLV